MGINLNKMRYCWACYSMSWFRPGSCCTNPDCGKFGWTAVMDCIYESQEHADYVAALHEHFTVYWDSKRTVDNAALLAAPEPAIPLTTAAQAADNAGRAKKATDRGMGMEPKATARQPPKPTAAKPTDAKPAASKPTAAKPTAAKLAAAKSKAKAGAKAGAKLGRPPKGPPMPKAPFPPKLPPMPTGPPAKAKGPPKAHPRLVPKGSLRKAPPMPKGPPADATP